MHCRPSSRNARPVTELARREFFRHLAGAALASWGADRVLGAEPPEVTAPRATSGDSRFEPHWDQRLTLTVGPERADLVGTTEKVIQAAIDSVARRGGGTVELRPGTYRLRNAVQLASGIRLKGSGPETLLIKEPSVSTRLAADSDWFDQELTLEDDAGFQVGDGLRLETRNPHDGGVDVVKRTVVARSGRRLKLDRPLRQNFWQMGETTCATLFPLIAGEENLSDLVIEDLTLDGNRGQNENFNGNYAGCIFLQDVSRATIRRVTARNFNGDGISWQIAHDVRVEDCHSHDHAGLALHPGSGSQRPVMVGNRLERCDIGVFFCWGVKYGLAENNELVENRLGISLGHRDTDNLVIGNRLRACRERGIVFRAERGPAFAPHRNRLEANEVVDTGDDSAVAIDLEGQTEGVLLKANVLRETRSRAQRVGIRIGQGTGRLELVDNHITGFATEVVDLRRART